MYNLSPVGRCFTINTIGLQVSPGRFDGFSGFTNRRLSRMGEVVAFIFFGSRLQTLEVLLNHDPQPSFLACGLRVFDSHLIAICPRLNQ